MAAAVAMYLSADGNNDTIWPGRVAPCAEPPTAPTDATVEATLPCDGNGMVPDGGVPLLLPPPLAAATTMAFSSGAAGHATAAARPNSRPHSAPGSVVMRPGTPITSWGPTLGNGTTRVNGRSGTGTLAAGLLPLPAGEWLRDGGAGVLGTGDLDGEWRLTGKANGRDDTNAALLAGAKAGVADVAGPDESAAAPQGRRRRLAIGWFGWWRRRR